MNTVTSFDTLQMQNDAGQILTFLIGEEEYGIDILKVCEIRGWTRTTPIPNAPGYVKGVINLRGSIVPVIDLRGRFGLAEQPYGPTTVVIVIRTRAESSEKTIGIVVDAVSDVYALGDQQQNISSDIGSLMSDRFVSGIITIDEKIIVLLDTDQLLVEAPKPISSAVSVS